MYLINSKIRKKIHIRNGGIHKKNGGIHEKVLNSIKQSIILQMKKM
jgi:hypothetical protein